MSSPTKHLIHCIQEIKRLYEGLEQIVPWEGFEIGDFEIQNLDKLQRLIPLLVDENRKIAALLSTRVLASGRMTGIKAPERQYYEEIVSPRSRMISRL